jgi:hypothetical protein
MAVLEAVHLVAEMLVVLERLLRVTMQLHLLEAEALVLVQQIARKTVEQV